MLELHNPGSASISDVNSALSSHPLIHLLSLLHCIQSHAPRIIRQPQTDMKDEMKMEAVDAVVR
jgi:hypothetical protein